MRGWITALDINTAKVIWKGFNIGLHKDVLIRRAPQTTRAHRLLHFEPQTAPQWRMS